MLENFIHMSEFLKNNLVFLRNRKGETQHETAMGLGFSRATYSHYEIGDNNPKLDKLEVIARYFGVTIEQLLNIDLENVHLNENKNAQKNRENVHLNVHPSVHLKGKKGSKSKNYPSIEEAGSVIEEDKVGYEYNQHIIDGLLLAIKALEASNSKHLEEIKQLKEQIIDLKREIPQIGTEMEGRNTMTA